MSNFKKLAGLTLFTFFTFILTSPSLACMSSVPDGLATGLVWRTKPKIVPTGSMIIKVDDLKSTPGTLAFTAIVKDGPREMLGKRYRFLPNTLNSCVGLGRQKGYLVIKRTAVSVKMNSAGQSGYYLSAIDYKPRWDDRLVSFLSGENWHFPGRLGNIESWVE